MGENPSSKEAHIDLTDDVASSENFTGSGSNKESQSVPSQANQQQSKKRQRRKRSIVWDHFDENEDRTHSTCKYCKIVFQSESKKDGISNLLAHVPKCEKNPTNIELQKQKILAWQKMCQKNGVGSTSGGNSKLVAIGYSKEACRRALTRMVIIDELPFRHVEGEGFREFCSVMQPKFDVPSRMTVVRDVFQMYLDEKKKLKYLLTSNSQRVCLTTDTWSSIQNVNYMVLTAHYVDNEWNLQKRILNFVQVPNHKGETVGKMIEQCLLEWGIERVFTITVDNASSNDGAISYMKKKLKSWKTSILDGDFLHVRCCAHIVNLIVSDGLKELDDSILSIRNAVRYVRSSPSRLLKFNACVEQERIQSGGSLILDVATRWNSTYLMLESAIKFQKAFERLEEEDGHFLAYFIDGENGKGRAGPPNDDHWMKAIHFSEFLKKFYHVTLKFSASLHVTSNVYFNELCAIYTHIMSKLRSNDPMLREMAKGMKAKYDKYWGSSDKINPLLFISVILDPRYKLRYVEWSFQDVYNDARDVVFIGGMVKKIKSDFERLYDCYCSMNVSPSRKKESRESDEVDMVENVDDDSEMTRLSRFKRHLMEADSLESKSEVDKYLLEAPELVVSTHFNVLAWWKSNSSRYPVLSQIARDILAVPVSTVASESAFSTGGRILDSYRSCLTPKTVQALICTQNWLRSTPSPFDLLSLAEDIHAFEKLESEFGNMTIASAD